MQKGKISIVAVDLVTVVKRLRKKLMNGEAKTEFPRTRNEEFRNPFKSKVLRGDILK